MVTEFGKTLRKKRIETGETMADLAKKLNVSTAFLSAVENGKRKIPARWVSEIARIYNFTEREREELENSATQSETYIKLDIASANRTKKNVAVSFARKFDGLTDDQIKEFQRLLMSVRGDT